MSTESSVAYANPPTATAGVEAEVETEVEVEAKAAPMATPSVKLCMESATRFRIPDACSLLQFRKVYLFLCSPSVSLSEIEAEE